MKSVGSCREPVRSVGGYMEPVRRVLVDTGNPYKYVGRCREPGRVDTEDPLRGNRYRDRVSGGPLAEG